MAGAWLAWMQLWLLFLSKEEVFVVAFLVFRNLEMVVSFPISSNFPVQLASESFHVH